MNLVERVYYFAMAAHAAVGQKRKYTGEDYIVHPVEVCDLLLVNVKDCPKEMLAAALLHDTIEDTQVTIELIMKEFGSCVATLVEGLTDISHADDGLRHHRKAIDRAHTAKQSPACKTIKLADLISNTSSIMKHDPKFAEVYMKEKELLLEVLTEGDPVLYKIASDIVAEYKRSKTDAS